MYILKSLFFIFLLSTITPANEGPIGAKAVVSDKSIVAGNIIQLHIRATGKFARFPHVKTIDGVKVLSQDERITNMHVYNMGKLKRECTILTLTFAPDKNITIPSYTVEIDGRTYKTKPIKLKVKKKNIDSDKIFSLKLESDTRSVMVGEPFLVTVSLSLRHGLKISKKLQYSRPGFTGFFVETLGKGKSYDEGDYQITELRYILTPHTDGNFTLGPAHAKIALQDKKDIHILNIGFARKWFQKASDTLDVEVLQNTVTSDLVGDFKLNAKIDTQEVEANSPVNLSVQIEGKGNLSDFYFPDYEMDGVTIYSDDAKISIDVKEGEIYSTYSKKFIFIAEKDFRIPERIFSMFDPKSKQLKELKIEALDIKIKNGQVSTSKPSKNSDLSFGDPRKLLSPKQQILLLVFLLGALFFYILRYLPKRKQNEYKESEALKVLYGHISKDPEVEEMVRKLYAKQNGDKSVKIDKKKLKELVDRFN